MLDAPVIETVAVPVPPIGIVELEAPVTSTVPDALPVSGKDWLLAAETWTAPVEELVIA